MLPVPACYEPLGNLLGTVCSRPRRMSIALFTVIRLVAGAVETPESVHNIRVCCQTRLLRRKRVTRLAAERTERQMLQTVGGSNTGNLKSR